MNVDDERLAERESINDELVAYAIKVLATEVRRGQAWIPDVLAQIAKSFGAGEPRDKNSAKRLANVLYCHALALDRPEAWLAVDRARSIAGESLNHYPQAPEAVAVKCQIQKPTKRCS